MSIIAIGTKLVVKKIEREQTSALGIIISNGQDPNPQGQIVSVGPEAQEKNPVLVPGVLIYPEWRNSVEVKHEGVTYNVIDMAGIYAVEV